MGTRVQPSQPKQVPFGFLATPLLPEKVTVSALPDQMLTVREVAGLLKVSMATVYKLCARGELENVRFLNVIRVPAGALAPSKRER